MIELTKSVDIEFNNEKLTVVGIYFPATKRLCDEFEIYALTDSEGKSAVERYFDKFDDIEKIVIKKLKEKE